MSGTPTPPQDPTPPGDRGRRRRADPAPPHTLLPPDPDADPAGAVLDEDLAAGDDGSYARGAKILSIGIASTGLLTFLFFSVASHALDEASYGPISVLWSILFVAMSVMYRPVEQLLSRTIATARARGEAHPSLREPLLIQAGFALVLLIVALAAKGPLVDRFEGSETLFWILVAAAMAYAASYFARGFVAGHQWFALYGGLVLFESVARILFPIAALVGITSGQTAVALGIAAAPFASLVVVPWAIVGLRRREGFGAAPAEPAAGSARGDALRAGGGFALAVALIQLGEQTLVNAGALLAPDALIAGIIFNALMVIRAPLQLFQSVQTSMLPHLSKMDAGADRAAFSRAIRQTVLVIAAFAGAVAIGLLAVGPFAMHVVFGADQDTYGRVGLAVVAVGMGAHLTAGTMNQAALARGDAWRAAWAWLASAALFVLWMVSGIVDDALLRAETGYAGGALLLCGLLWLVYRRGAAEDRAPAAA